MLLLDTELLPAAERRSALTEVMAEMTRATRLGLADGPRGPRARLEAWDFGPAAFFRAGGEGLSMARSAAAAAADDEPYVSLAIHLRGTGRSEHLDRRRLLRPGDVAVIDLRAPYEFAWEGDAANLALNIPVTELDLPAEVVQAGSTHLESSPLLGLARAHLQALAADLDAVTGNPQAPTAAAATIRITRLLLASAAQHRKLALDAHDEALPDLLAAYAARNGGLHVQRAARALGTGPRYLVRRCPGVVGGRHPTT